VAALTGMMVWLLVGPVERAGLRLEQPNEGWNAGHALQAFSPALYPGPGALFINNYPPLWFYLTGALARWFGDPILPARIVAFAAFFGVAAAIYALARNLRIDAGAAAIGALGFVVTAAAFFRAYVGLDEPQMLAHALATAAAAAAMGSRRRRGIAVAALLTVLALLVKQIVVGLPIAVTLFLLLRRRHLLGAWIATGLAAAVIALAALLAAYGSSFVSNVISPRYFSFERLGTSLAATLRVITPLVAFGVAAWGVRRRWDDAVLFAALAIAAAYAPIVVFGSVLGVSFNIGFDLAIAASLGLAVGWARTQEALGRWGAPWRAVVAVALVAVPILDAPRDVRDPAALANAQATAVTSAALTTRIASLKGPVVCETLSICIWAGKPSAADLWKLHNERTLAFLDPAPMLARIRAGGYAGVVTMRPLIRPADDRDLPGLGAALAAGYAPPVIYPGVGALYLPKARP